MTRCGKRTRHQVLTNPARSLPPRGDGSWRRFRPPRGEPRGPKRPDGHCKSWPGRQRLPIDGHCPSRGPRRSGPWMPDSARRGPRAAVKPDAGTPSFAILRGMPRPAPRKACFNPMRYGWRRSEGGPCEQKNQKIARMTDLLQPFSGPGRRFGQPGSAWEERCGSRPAPSRLAAPGIGRGRRASPPRTFPSPGPGSRGGPRWPVKVRCWPARPRSGQVGPAPRLDIRWRSDALPSARRKRRAAGGV
jgi:hypothetical protein